MGFGWIDGAEIGLCIFLIMDEERGDDGDDGDNDEDGDDDIVDVDIDDGDDIVILVYLGLIYLG